MEKLDLSTHAKEIKSLFDKVGSGDESTTYFVLTSEKGGVVRPTASGAGDIRDFVQEFEEGKVQFGYLRITPPGSDVAKVVLLGWCPDSAPLRSRTSFAHNFAEVAKSMHRYHVQITARDSDDLDVADIIKTVSDAAGARYSIQSVTSTTPSFKPKPKAASPAPASTKPAVVKPILPKPTVKPAAVKDDSDEWGGEEEIQERDFSKNPLVSEPSAYKPTKVDIDALRKGTTPEVITPATKPKPVEPERSVSPAAPISSKVHQYDSFADDGRLTSLPKPKVSHSVSARYQPVVQPQFGTKVPDFAAKKVETHSTHSASRDFAGENGKTPAQIWAEKHGKYKVVESDEAPVRSSSAEPEESSIADVRSKFAAASVDEKPRAVFPPKTAEPESEPEAEPEAESEPEQPEPEEEPVPAPLPPREPAKEASPVPLPPREPVKATSTISAIAEYEYEKDESNEISFEEGETIINIEKVDEDWWKGTNSKGETGLFPATYVKEIEEDVAPAQERAVPPPPPAREPVEEKKSGPSAIAEYDYEATEDNELTFAEGDEITDIEFVDDDWWLGSFKGERKLFPSNYVTLKE